MDLGRPDATGKVHGRARPRLLRRTASGWASHLDVLPGPRPGIHCHRGPGRVSYTLLSLTAASKCSCVVRFSARQQQQQ